MPRFLEYTLFFVVLLLLQVFLFDNLSLWVYIAPLPYVAFLVMLPPNTGRGLLVFLGFVTGVVLDFMTGTGGLHTIASTFTGFARPGIVAVTMGKDFWRDSGDVITRGNIRSGKWMRCSALMVLLHCIVFFMFEALSFRYFGHTLLKIVMSSAVTVLLVWFTGLLYPLKR